MLIKKFIIGLLSFYAIEIRKTSLERVSSTDFDVKVERLYESFKRREEEKKKSRTYDKRKWKKKALFAPVHFKLSGVKPKDRRFSNQRNLRRMYRNV